MAISISLTDAKSVQRVQSHLEAMSTWSHWPEIALGAQKEYGMTAKAFYQALPEFQKFMSLTAEYPGLGMLSESVDQVWHSMILNTMRYQEFCLEFVGRMVHHLPCSSYGLYGVSAASTCSMPPTPPSSCTDPWPAPPDPSPVPPKRADLQWSILEGSQRFVTAYTDVFGHAPDPAIWPRATLVDGIAL